MKGTPRRIGIHAASRKDVVDLCELARRDHEDLDRALQAMLAPETPDSEAANLLDIFRMCLAVHLIAEARVFAMLVSIVRPPPQLRLQIAQLRNDHVAQQRAAERLATLQPSSREWLSATLELRVLLLGHAEREEYLRGALDAHVPTKIGRGIAAQYAIERMHLLGTTSPLQLARSA
jgi:hypothetical protein